MSATNGTFTRKEATWWLSGALTLVLGLGAWSWGIHRSQPHVGAMQSDHFKTFMQQRKDHINQRFDRIEQTQDKLASKLDSVISKLK